MIQVSVNKLKKICNPYKDKVWGYKKLKKSMVRSATELNQFEQQTVSNSVSILTHAKRVAYLANYPDDTPVVVDCGTEFIKPVIRSGIHQLAAAIINKESHINAIVYGEVNRVEELL